MKIIDTHAHLLKANYEDFDDVVKDSLENLLMVFNVGFDIQSSREVIEINKIYSQIKPIIGIHPDGCNDSKYINEDIAELETLINNDVIAIGEIGLDYYREHNKESQYSYFIKQIELAIKYDLPVVIHSRESLIEVFDIIKKYNNVKFLIHSWTGNTKKLSKFLSLENIWFGFNGMLTFKNTIDIKESFLMIPIEKIIFETDCPYLTPAPNRGKKNFPKYVEIVIEFASRMLKKEKKNLIEISYENTLDFFNLNNES